MKLSVSFSMLSIGASVSAKTLLRGDEQRDLQIGNHPSTSRPLDMSEFGGSDEIGCQGLYSVVTLPFFPASAFSGYVVCCGPDTENIRTNPDGPDCCLYNTYDAETGVALTFGFATLQGNGECPGVWPAGQPMYAMDVKPGKNKEEMEAAMQMLTV